MATFKVLLNISILLQPGLYALGAIDFHWPSSEHAIDGKRYDFEAQFHHFEPKYDTLEDALEVEGAVVSLAFLFQVRYFKVSLIKC